MISIVLYHPEIPPNTGNVMRLCANTGAQLHLVGPLGFELEDKQLRRAGLDYREWASVQVHEDLDTFLATRPASRLLVMSARGNTSCYDCRFRDDDILLFGPESTGVPEELLQRVPEAQRLRIPMRAGNRSLNLSNSVAVVVYEAWRQSGFAGAG
jgi:tRNA (cytidine/uridine-2'-O-)-methyltransferase